MENDDEDKYTSVSDDPLSNLILEVIKNDSLRKIERGKRHEAEHCILTAAKLISPVSLCEIILIFYIYENFQSLLVKDGCGVPEIGFSCN